MAQRSPPALEAWLEQRQRSWSFKHDSPQTRARLNLIPRISNLLDWMERMHLIIAHYHLNRGGVTRVIESHLASLAAIAPDQQPTSVTILHGGRIDGWNAPTSDLPFPVEFRTMQSLEYDSLQAASDVKSDENGRLYREFSDILSANNRIPNETVVHIHNHGLGKNSSLLSALSSLADDGWRMLLQIHDFAEELRPENYRHLAERYDSLADLQMRLYPQSEQIHYATLTERDANVLRTAKIQDARIHLLPNPVMPSQTSPNRDAARQKLLDQCGVPVHRPYVLYPVRGIRRKNVGELLLWAAMLPDMTFAITLAPKNPLERESFDHWKRVGEELSLPVLFDVGDSGGMGLEENYAAADAVITTSIAEGFGLVFLEASMAGLPLFGRNLSDVTTDFRNQGVQFPGLAEQLNFPVEHLDVIRLKSLYTDLATELGQQYETPIDQETLKADVEEIFAGPYVDFARLDRYAQEQAIRLVAEREEVQSALFPLNPTFAMLRDSIVSSHDTQAVIAANQKNIQECFGLRYIGQRYASICEGLLNSDGALEKPAATIGQSVLASFLKVKNIYSIRLEE